MVICGLPRSTTFYYIVSRMTRFSKKKINKNIYIYIYIYNVCFEFYKFCPKYSLFCVKFGAIRQKMYIGLRVNCPLFLSNFSETWIFLDRFSQTHSNIKFHENSSSGSKDVPCGRTDWHDEANSRFSKFTGLYRHWGFQEVEDPRFPDSRNMKLKRLSALRTGRFYSPGYIPGIHFCYRLSRPQGHSAAGRIKSIKNSSETVGIEPATFGLVAKCHNQLRYLEPSKM